MNGLAATLPSPDILAQTRAMQSKGGAVGREVRDYDDIPGTYVFDAQHSRAGYHLNMFCMSLNQEHNRESFRTDPEGYLDTFPLTPEQRAAVLNRDWLEMLRLGGNIYYTFKIAAFDGITMQHVGGSMSGQGMEAFRQMMIDGGRSIDGNRSKSDWEAKVANDG